MRVFENKVLNWLGQHHFFWTLGQSIFIVELFIVVNIELAFVNGFVTGRITELLWQPINDLTIKTLPEQVLAFIFISFCGWFIIHVGGERFERYWKLIRKRETLA